jgi:hypothetical protein
MALAHRHKARCIRDHQHKGWQNATGFHEVNFEDDMPDRKMPVNKFLAAAAFIIVSAQRAVSQDHQIECDRYSSSAGGQRTILQFQHDPNGADFILRKPGLEEYWHFAGSVGIGLEGSVYSLTNNPETQGNTLYSVAVVLDHNANPPKETNLLIFQDMAFWPNCK